MAIRVGTDGLIELTPTAWTYSPATGQLAVRRFKGPHATAEAYAESLIGTGIEVMLEPIEGTPLSIVTIRDVSGTGGGSGVDANVETVWTLQPHVEEVSSFQHPSVRADVALLSAESLVQFNADVKAVLNGDESAQWWTRYPRASAIYKAMALVSASPANENYQITRASLRKSRVVSPNSSIKADWVGVGKIYSTTRLVQLESIPEAIIGRLEAGDWYKSAGTVEQLSDGRFTISTEWSYRETDGWDLSLLYSRG